MSGDYSRFSHKPSNRFAGVLMQQGRVQLDSDWNELVGILRRRDRLQAKDTFGPAGVPVATTPDAFKITLSSDNPPDLVFGPGRFYVDGLLAELFEGEAVHYSQQPFLPNPEAMDAELIHLVYLDVWEREVTAIQDPGLLEKALSGPDTTTRLQTVWQIKFTSKGVGGARPSCATDLNALFPPSAGRLTTRAFQPAPAATPCTLAESGGYSGFDNRLYRIQIHQGGTLGQARFKWSRENASVVSRVTGLATADVSEITVDRIGKDDILRFSAGDWVEILDDEHELTNRPGAMARVKQVRSSDSTLVLDRQLPPEFEPLRPELHTRVVRWDQRKGVDDDGLLPVGTSVVLEDGIQVDFSLDPAAPNGEFHSDDYWCFAARTTDASVEQLSDARPLGVVHHYAALGVVDPTVNPMTVHDCRTLWPAAHTAPVTSDLPTPGQYRCYQVDCDNGDDATAVVGVGDSAALAVAAVGGHRFKTLSGVAQRVPRIGNDSIAMILIGRGTGAGAGDYGAEALILGGVVGYRKLVIRGSDYSNSAADKASCAAKLLATGTINSRMGDRMGLDTLRLQVDLTPTSVVPTGSAWRGARLTFASDTPTAALRGKTLMLDQVDPGQTTPSAGTYHALYTCEAILPTLGTEPLAGDRFVIEGQSVHLSVLRIDGATSQSMNPTIGGTVSIAGLSAVDLIVSGTLGVETAFTTLSNVLVAEESGLVRLRAGVDYWDEDGHAAIVGVSVAVGSCLAARGLEHLSLSRVLLPGGAYLDQYGILELTDCSSTKEMIILGAGHVKVAGGTYMGFLFGSAFHAEFDGVASVPPLDSIAPWLDVRGSGSTLLLNNLHGWRGSLGRVVVLRSCVHDTNVVFLGTNNTISSPTAILMSDGAGYDFSMLKWTDARDDRNNHAQYEGHCITNPGLLLDVAVNSNEYCGPYSIVRLNQEDNKTVLRLAIPSSWDVIGIVQSQAPSTSGADNRMVRVATSGLSVVALAPPPPQSPAMLPGAVLTLGDGGRATTGGSVRLGVLVSVLDAYRGIVRLA